MGGDASYNSASSLHTFEDELIVEDYDHFAATGARPAAVPTHPVWAVDAEDLKMLHRVGRGNFGDVWLCTLHNSTAEFDEFHEVAVKVLPPISEDQARILYRKFATLFQASQGLKGVSWPRGISTKNGKVDLLNSVFNLFTFELISPEPDFQVAPPR